MVFIRAQEILRTTFGVEMVELQSRAAIAQDAEDPEPPQVDTKKGKKPTAAGKRAPGGGAKAYIIRSLLDPALIALANAPDRELCRLEAARAEPAHEDFAALYGGDEDEDDSTRSTGAILAWDRSDEVASVGVLYLILAFILVEGRVIRDRESPYLIAQHQCH